MLAVKFVIKFSSSKGEAVEADRVALVRSRQSHRAWK